VDQMIRRWRGRGPRVEPRGRGYGFAQWLPGIVFGTAMAGAGIAKLRGSGLAWILGGAVKYHFVVDSQNAPVNWGLWIASHHGAAVAMSFMAVTVELGLSLAPWLRTYAARLPLGLAGLGLLVGFHLFQNERWLAWWMVWGLFYVPWPRLFRLCRRAIPAHLVFIDGECARCRRTARLLTGLDLFNRLRFIPLQRRVAWRRFGGTVREDELLRSMHVLCLGRNRLVRGYRAYLHLGQSLPICWPLLPVASLLLVGELGERMYAHLAKGRTRKLIELCPRQSAGGPRGASLGWAAAIVTFTVCLLQVTASVAEVEVEPIMSSYPMYSNTYQSTNDFDRRVTLHLSYSFAATVNGQEEDVTELFDSLGIDEVFRDALLRLAENGRLDDDARARVRAAVSLFQSRTGRTVTYVWLKTDEQAFDWHRGVFFQKRKGTVLGMLDVRSLQGT
jgi:predicted DCC family thiol-disulfide oxidoreductase YuxK